ncbi:MAG: hypothetical protein QM764_11825 [Chitinophagaceae bacterium]
MNKVVAIFIVSSFLLNACNNNDQNIVKFVSTDALYFDYQVWGDDEKNMITVMLQFRSPDENGKPVALLSPSKVELDGKALSADSTKKSGAYYEYSTTIDSFAGKHSIQLTGITGNKYEEKFEFKPFQIAESLNDTIHRGEFVIKLEGLEKQDYLRVFALDTAFRSKGINENDTVKNGEIVITKEQLKNLVNGPVRLEIYKEQQKPVQNGTSAGGYLVITYGVKKNILLKD